MSDLLLTKLTHACVRVVVDGAVLVIDPGTFGDATQVDGADAILITHEHADHVDPAALARTRVPVFVPDGAEIDGLDALDVTRVAAGSTFRAAGIEVRVVGERHGLTFGGLPSCANFGYLVDGRLYHPGDALALPGVPVETLLVPMAGPWLKLGEAIEFVRAVRPGRAVGIHDEMLSERGLETINRWLTGQSETDYRYLRAGADA